jgi:hypothetical protein
MNGEEPEKCWIKAKSGTNQSRHHDTRECFFCVALAIILMDRLLFVAAYRRINSLSAHKLSTEADGESSTFFRSLRFRFAL